MKKTLLAIGMVTALAAAGAAADMSAMLTFSYLGAADSGYREVYGSGGFMPGLRLEAAVGGGLSAYAAYGYFAGRGETPVLGLESESTQHYASAGAAWRRELSAKVDGFLHAGVLYVSYREEAMGDKATGNALGAEAGAGLGIRLTRSLLLQPLVSYLYAGDTVDGFKVKLGGLRAGLGLGLRF